MRVDINGQENGPNKNGSDIFFLTVVKESNGSYSAGAFGSKPGHTYYPVTYSNERCSGTYAHSCAAEILGGLTSLY
jgi:hypothetical protein